MALHSPTTLTTPREDLKGSFKQGQLTFEASCLRWLRPLKMMKTKGTLDVLTPQSLLALPTNADRNKDGSYNFTDSDRTEITFKTKSYGLNHAYDEEDRADYEDEYKYESSITQMTWARVMRRMELRALALVNTTTFATGTRGHSASSSWSDTTNGDPALDTKKAKQGVYDRSGEIINAAVMSWRNIWDAWNSEKLWKNSRYVRDIPGDPDLTAIARQLGLKYVIPWGGKYNTAKEGQTAALGELANTDYVFFCKIAETDSNDEPCVGRILYHDGYGGLGSVKTIENPMNDQTVYRVYQKVQEKIFWADLGWLMVNAD